MAALRDLGGAAIARDLRVRVIELGDFTEEELRAPSRSSASRSWLHHSIDRVIQTLRKLSLIEHDGGRPVTWSLTPRGNEISDTQLIRALKGRW
jgi:hypothetical protein